MALKEGDRIACVAMPQEKNPIPAGAQGTVTFVTQVGSGRDAFTQIGVNWDNGRTLMLVVPPDQYERVL